MEISTYIYSLSVILVRVEDGGGTGVYVLEFNLKNPSEIEKFFTK